MEISNAPVGRKPVDKQEKEIALLHGKL